MASKKKAKPARGSQGGALKKRLLAAIQDEVKALKSKDVAGQQFVADLNPFLDFDAH